MTYVYVLLAIASLLVTGCSSAVVKYAQRRNPGCQVTEVQRTSGASIVLIQCPGQDPKTETFTER